MKTMLEMTCPKCGANLSAETDRDAIFCIHCGVKILLNDENTYTIRNVDEAKIKQAETDHIIRIKQIEMAEKRAEATQRNLKLKVIISLSLAIVGIFMMVIGGMAGQASGDPDSGFYMLTLIGFFPLMGAAYIWLNSKKEDDGNDYGDMVRVPSAVDSLQSKNHAVIVSIFKAAGFKNVQCIPLNDLTIGILKKPGMVESISINGNEITSSGKKFPSSASVVISYHSFANR